MQTINDIKVILYDRNDTGNKITSRFLSLSNKEFIPYPDEGGLSGIIEELKKTGLRSKDLLILKKFMGRVFQKCPGSKNVICCNYHLLNTCFDCLFDCAYCFLNSYLNSYGIVQFTNVFEQGDEIGARLEKEGSGKIMRIGTGEFTDSLMMDKITGIGAYYIEKFSRHKNIFLELKTKSSDIGHLLDIREKGNAVLAWSLNTERNIGLYEAGTAALEDRIRAAVGAAESGYYTAFHFDPVILYKNCMDDYLALIDELLKRVDNGRIVWISMGCFRYGPGFKEILRDKFPDEDLTVEEIFQGRDGKWRYFKDKRVDIYKAMKNRIESHTRVPFIYLCMESPDVWDLAFGKRYSVSEDLEADISRRLIKNFL